MRTCDHYRLGRFLLGRMGLSPRSTCRKLFLLGCVGPDWNPVTYARGSLKYRFFHGHNAENVRGHLTHVLRRLMESGVSTPWQWFAFGAALHYLADSFTFAHNTAFTGNLIAHSAYERALHVVFEQYLDDEEALSAALAAAEAADGAVWHERYAAERCSCRTDCHYILGTAFALCGRLPFLASPPGMALANGAPMSPAKSLFHE